MTPALAAAVLFTAHLLRYVGEGPRWESISYLEQGCQKYWWTTLLYVQNYVNNDTYVSRIVSDLNHASNTSKNIFI